MRQVMSSPKFRSFAILPAAALCVFSIGCAQQAAQPGNALLGSETLPSPLASPYTGTPVAYLDDYPVTAAEVEDFARANLIEGSHHGSGDKGADVFKLL